MRRYLIPVLLVAGWLAAAPAPVHAYIGPGAGISVIGTAVAFVGAVLLAIVGFVWYPIKRLLALVRRGRARDEEPQPSS